MRELDNLCVKCFEELTSGAICSHCGYDNDTIVEQTYLAPKTILNEKYVIGAVKNIESDSVTYSGYDSQLDKTILIREFFPNSLVNRLEDDNNIHVRQKFLSTISTYKKAYYNLWTTLEKNHSLSAVVPVYDVFEANDTIYAIIENINSISLRDYLLRSEDSIISWDNARIMFMPVLTTLEALHSNNIIHGSITPDNLMLCEDGKVRLAPFSISDSANEMSPLNFNENVGYTAIEQYTNKHAMAPSTDIYAFAACLYRSLVGTNPPSAKEREANDKLMIPNSIAETIPMHVIKAMGGALQIYPEKRIKNVSLLRDLLEASPNVQIKGQANDLKKGEDAEDDNKNKKSKVVILFLIALIIIAIGAGVYVVKNTDLLTAVEEESTTQEVAATYEVPNFCNNAYTQSDIENNGAWNEQFTFTYTSEYSTDVDEGIIFAQSVAAGETVDAKTEIILTVSKGIQTEVIPDVGGLSLSDATKELENLGFKVSSVEIYNDGSHTEGTVRQNYGMAPAANETVAYGSEIIIQVYGAAQTTTEATTTEIETTEPSVEVVE